MVFLLPPKIADLYGAFGTPRTVPVALSQTTRMASGQTYTPYRIQSRFGLIRSSVISAW